MVGWEPESFQLSHCVFDVKAKRNITLNTQPCGMISSLKTELSTSSGLSVQLFLYPVDYNIHHA